MLQMRKRALAIILPALCAMLTAPIQANAGEGLTLAGPIGGTDMRAAHLPPPGLWGGVFQVYGRGQEYYDGNGRAVAQLDGLDLVGLRTGAQFIYVPKVQIMGGSVGIIGSIFGGSSSGRINRLKPSQERSGLGDPYVEAAWSRFFGHVRSSTYAGAPPIQEGLSISTGVGAIIPLGQYSVRDAADGLALGKNIWDIAPFAAVTYMTPSLLAEGTEFSAKLYSNNYLTNPDTNYLSGHVWSLNFAVTERVGRLQLGLAGYYAQQTQDDTIGGAKFAADGRRAEVLSLGVAMVYAIPEWQGALKLKTNTSVLERNTVSSTGVMLGWVQKLN